MQNLCTRNSISSMYVIENILLTFCLGLAKEIKLVWSLHSYFPIVLKTVFIAFFYTRFIPVEPIKDVLYGCIFEEKQELMPTYCWLWRCASQPDTITPSDAANLGMLLSCQRASTACTCTVFYSSSVTQVSNTKRKIFRSGVPHFA